MSVSHNFTHRTHRYTLSFSPRGIARFTFADGMKITLTGQASPAQAIRKAEQLHRAEHERMARHG